MKKFYKKIAVLMSLIASFSAPMQELSAAFAATNTVPAANQESESTAWIVPVLEWRDFEHTTRQAINMYNMEIDNKAFVTKNQDDTYHVRLRYSGYSIFDIVQVVNPENNEKALEYINESRGRSQIAYLDWGNFNIKPSEDFLNPAMYETIAPYIKDEANYLYFTQENEISIRQADAAMDTGYIEFDISDLSDQVVINECYSYSVNTAIMNSAFVIDFSEDEAVAVPASLCYEPGTYSMGFDWTNYINAAETSTNSRNTDAAALEYLYSVFENEVKVTVDENGTFAAVFTIKKESDNPPLSISIAESRDTSPETIAKGTALKKRRYSKDLLGITYKELWNSNSENDQISIPFQDLFDGKIMKITNAASANPYFGHLWLTQEVRSDSKEISVTDKGAILTSNTNNLPGFYKFEILNPTLEEVSDIVLEGTVKAIEAFSKTDDSYRVYQYRIYDSNMQVMEPKGQFTIDLPVPDEFDFDKTIYYYASELENSSKHGYGLPSEEAEVVEIDGNKYLRLSPKDMKDAYYTIVMYDQGSPMTSDDLADLEEGYYKVRPTIGMISSGTTDRPSMSASAIKDREAVLEVVKKGEEYNLYFDLQGVMAAGTYGYVYKWFTYDGEEQNIKVESEAYRYKSANDLFEYEWEKYEPERSDDNLTIDPFVDDYQLYYLQTVKMPLANQKSNGAFKIGVVVPFMNGFTSAGIKEGIKTADVRLIKGSLEPATEADVPKLHKSLLLGVMYDVNWFLQSQGENPDAALKTAYDEAETVYRTMEDEPDQELLLSEIEKLKHALIAAGGGQTDTRLVTDGTYKVSYKIYDNNTDNLSQMSNYFSGQADLTVKDEQMTVTLQAVDFNEDYLTRLQYDNGINLADAEIQQDESGKAVSFRFTRPYTEERFEIDVYTDRKGYQQTLQLFLELETATKVTASDEDVAELNNLLTELKALNAEDYTKASMDALTAAVNDVELVLSQSDYLEYDTLQAQLTKLNTAKDGLVSLVDLKAKVEEAKKVTDASEDLAAAITAAEAVIAKEDASRSEVLAAVSRLNFLMGTNGSVSTLEDGMYTVPFEILQDGAVSGSWDDVFRQVEVKVEGDTVSLIASMKENDLGQIRFSVSGKDPSEAEVIGKNGSWIERWQGSYLKSADADKALYAYLYQNGASAPEVVEIRLDYSAAQASADKTALYEALLDARAKLENSADYTQESVELLKDAVSDAEDILYDYAASQSRTDRAETSLDKAASGLERAVDRTGLADKIKEAVAYWDQKDVYTVSTRNALAVVIEEAREVYGATTVTQNSIDAQIAALEDATAALEYISREELGVLIEKLEGYREVAYTKDSWAKLVTAIKEAKASYEQTDLEDQDYKDAKASLQSAADALEELPDVSESLKELDVLLDTLLGNLAAEELYEPTSYASFMASVAASEDLLDTSNEYELTDEMIEDQMAALEAEFSALIPLERLSEENLEAESYSYKRISYSAFDIDAEAETEAEAEYEEDLEDELDGAFEEELEDDVIQETSGSSSNRFDQEETQTKDSTETDSKNETAAETKAETETEGKTETEEDTEKETEAETREETEAETEAESEAETEAETEAEMEADTESEAEEETEAETESEVEEKVEAETEAEEDAEEEAEVEKADDEEILLSFSTHPKYYVFAAASPSNAGRKEAESSAPVRIPETAKAAKTKATASNTAGGISAYSIDSFGDIFEDGVYCVNFDLWQFAENKESMGNGAVKDAFPDKSGKQAKLVIDGSNAYVYLEFQKMQFNGLTGHLLDMFMMDNLKTDSEGVIDTYDEVEADILEYTDEVDDFGPPSGRKYPKLLRFEISKYMAARNQYIPVQVNVPVMGASAEQPAYIRCYWNTLALVEGAEPDEPDEPIIPEDPVDPLVYDELEEALDQVSTANKSDYTAKSYAALEASIKAGDTLFILAGVDQDMIDARTDALLATYKALVLVSGEDDPGTNPTPGEDEKPSDDSLKILMEELQEAVRTANTYYASNYTEESYQVLAAAIKAANQILRSGSATELQVQRALNKLYDAEDNLVARSNGSSSTGVDKSELNKWIVRVSNLTSSNYNSSVYEQFAGTLNYAKIVYNDTNATEDQVASAASSLESAYIMLVTGGSGSSSGSGSGSSSGGSDDEDKSGSNEDDGYYEVNVRLWHATMNKASMGDPAIVRKAYVHIDDGDITMRLQTKKMTTSGITTHLYEFYIYDSGDYEEADLISTENSKWTYEFELPNDNNTYYKCKVDPRVDVMGDDPVKARLKVDWDSLDEVDEDDWDDLEGDTDDDDDDDDSTSSSSGTGSNTTLVSAETGIRAQGKLNGPGYVLEATRISSGSQYDMTANALSDADVNQFVVYDVKLRSGSTYVQPTSTITMSIPIPAGYDTNKLLLYRINEDGTRYEIAGRVNGSYYEAGVDHFSLYTLAESNQVTAVAAAAPAAGSKSSAASGTAASGTSGTSGSTRNVSTGSRTSTSGTARSSSGSVGTGSSRLGSGTSAVSAAGTAHMVNGREIPYTGDTMPLKELAGVGFLAVLTFLSTVIPGKRRDEELAAGRACSRAERRSSL